MTPRIGALFYRRNCEWGLQGEVQHRLGRELDLLSLGGCLDAPAEAAARRGTNSGTLPPSSDPADDSPYGSSGTHFFSRVDGA